MRFFAIASVLIILAWGTLCVTPVVATPPAEPPDGAGYLDQGARIKTLPHWVPGSGQWAKSTFDRVNPALLSKRSGGAPTHSATPIPIPSPRSAARLGVFQPGSGTHSATPMPLPEPKTVARFGAFQPWQKTQSATPMPLPEPKTVARFGAFQPWQKTQSVTPIPIPEPKSAAYSGGFQQKPMKTGAKSTRTFGYYRSAR